MENENNNAAVETSPPQIEAELRSRAELAEVAANEATDRANKLAVDLGIANDRVRVLEIEVQKQSEAETGYICT